MALDEKAGQRRAISITRNFGPSPGDSESAPQISQSEPAKTEILASASAFAGASSSDIKSGTSDTVRRANTLNAARSRYYKMSFYSTDELRERFRIARLKGGFNTIEDAHNKALEMFCEMVETGKLSNF